MAEEILLSNHHAPEDERVIVKFDVADRWPVHIIGADKYYIALTEQEAQALMSALQKRYPLDAVSSV